jgi:hypothetical protein
LVLNTSRLKEISVALSKKYAEPWGATLSWYAHELALKGAVCFSTIAPPSLPASFPRNLHPSMLETIGEPGRFPPLAGFQLKNGAEVTPSKMTTFLGTN